ncbi:MAG: DUF2516 family protein [Trueperella sp.]|nr:DUF2516 family protein [Trueperella sp.]
MPDFTNFDLDKIDLTHISMLFSLAALVLFGYALLDALRRPERDFARARKNKNFWVTVLGSSTAFYAFFQIGSLSMPMEGLIGLAALVAVVYYLGPERQAMRPRDLGGGGGKWPKSGPGGGWSNSGSDGGWRRW